MPHYSDNNVTIHHGDCIEILRTLPDNSIDAIVTDPPYGLEFMGKEWDAPWKAAARAQSATTVDPAAVGGFQDGTGGNAYSRSRVRTNTQRHGGDTKLANIGFQTWCEQWTTECLRVLKPGGHILAFGGTRTYHRLAVAIEDAGFEIRDSLAWLYGSGFPKSMDVSKAIDKALGVEREDKFGGVIDRRIGPTGNGKCDECGKWLVSSNPCTCPRPQDEPVSDTAKQWQGWGTALKPAYEPIVLARKPLADKTVTRNVLNHGTGALNVDACRIETNDNLNGGTYSTGGNRSSLPGAIKGKAGDTGYYAEGGGRLPGQYVQPSGRFPANVVLSHNADCGDTCTPQCPVAELDAQSGERKAGGKVKGHEPSRTGQNGIYNTYGRVENAPFHDTGGASRFFYVAKAARRERPEVDGVAHPTVKPLALMRWLVRMITPTGGTVLDPFAGSGTTLEAARSEGFKAVGIEREQQYLPLIEKRLGLAGDNDWTLDFDAAA